MLKIVKNKKSVKKSDFNSNRLIIHGSANEEKNPVIKHRNSTDKEQQIIPVEKNTSNSLFEIY